jgi:dihydroorotate dehydrogenase
MWLYRQLLFPILCRIDPETTHDLTLRALAFAQERRAGMVILDAIAGQVPNRPVELFGLHFPNELGVAAGFDKNADVVPGLRRLGFGHVEVGTLTPRAQEGNPKPRIFRLPEDGALVNRMGFPNKGVEHVLGGISSVDGGRDGLVLGVSLGKQKKTKLEDAAADYRAVMARVFADADYLAINVSSPNTPRLRELQGRKYLAQLLQAVMESNRELANQHRRRSCPVLLKISPDLEWQQLDGVLEVADDHGISGIIATNTTVSRASLSSRWRDEAGGVSGRPLRTRSNEMINYIRRHSGDRLPVVGAGGVMSADDVKEKIDAGASLVQMYTGIVYGGPGIAGQILRRL